MAPVLDLAPKRTRESTSKVRSGCITCKARRVKCDETKPVCQRCAVGRRKCQYTPAGAGPPPRNVITVYLAPTQNQPVLFLNERGLDFFHQNIAAQLDGHFGTKFWSKLVLQLSHSEPSIRHAISAISVIYQDVESSLQHPTGYVKANLKAQQEWNTAVKSLSGRIQAHPNSALVPLVCCLLFTCIDFLRGNVESSLLHVQSGFNIIAALRRNGDAALDPGFSFSSDDLRPIEDHVIPMFSGLNVLSCLAGRMVPPVYPPTTKEDHPHDDLTDSRRRLTKILDTCIRFIHDVVPQAATDQVGFDDLAEQAKLQTRLETWREQLDKLLQRMHGAGIPVKQDVLSLLLVHYKIIYIWVRVCTVVAETATDAYHADFEELVQHAERVVKPSAGIATPQHLSFDIKILGPLYYAVLKCRHPAIRRRALELLRLAPRREGLWNAHHAYATGKRIIELEETHLNGDGLPDETSRIHSLPLPDNNCRIWNPDEIPVDPWKFDHSIVPSPACPGMVEAVFQTKPWGLSGEWHTVTEFIKL